MKKKSEMDEALHEYATAAADTVRKKKPTPVDTVRLKKDIAGDDKASLRGATSYLDADDTKVTQMTPDGWKAMLRADARRDTLAKTRKGEIPTKKATRQENQ